MREIAIDTETTGLGPHEHRIIEIGCVEIVNREITGTTFRRLVNPGRAIDAQATRVHGFTDEDVQSEETFSSIAEDFIKFIRGSHVLMHNASFDVGFIDMELERSGRSDRLEALSAGITDTLVLATDMFPSGRANLDAVCRRFSIDVSGRSVHGALKDASLLAQLYLRMTGGQLSIFETAPDANATGPVAARATIREDRSPLVLRATAEEVRLHKDYMERLASSRASV